MEEHTLLIAALVLKGGLFCLNFNKAANLVNLFKESKTCLLF